MRSGGSGSPVKTRSALIYFYDQCTFHAVSIKATPKIFCWSSQVRRPPPLGPTTITWLQVVFRRSRFAVLIKYKINPRCACNNAAPRVQVKHVAGTIFQVFSSRICFLDIRTFCRCNRPRKPTPSSLLELSWVRPCWLCHFNIRRA